MMILQYATFLFEDFEIKRKMPLNNRKSIS